MNSSIKVMLWDEEIGRLSWDNRRKTSYFTYNPEYVSKGLELAPLTAPIKGGNTLMPVWGESGKIYQKLPAFLADSLPDSWGNQLFDLWAKEQHIAKPDITPLEKLSFIGRRGMGALEFIPEVKLGKSKDKVDVQSLIELAQRIFKDRENAVIRPDESITMQALIAVGTSAGGRQPKAILAVNRETGEITSGQIAGQENSDYCILKFGDASRSTAELEMAYYRMAIAAGITMMHSELKEVGECRHFLTMRYDRDGSRKLHTQTLAAISPDDDSYESLLTTCRKLHLPESDCQEIFRRMVFNHLANNTDDHNKNFTFIMTTDGQWRLSPAYDMTFIFDLGGYLPNRDHCIFTRGKLSGLTLQDALDFAKENGIRRPESIIRKVAGSIVRFREFATECGAADEWIGCIETCLDANLKAWGFKQEEGESAFEIDGHSIENPQLTQAYKGNLHLSATVDGKDRKYIIRQGTEEYERITKAGISNIKTEYLMELVGRYIIQ